MIDQKNIETLFDCFDESATLLYKNYKTSYLDGLIITCENIMANSIEEKYAKNKDELQNILDRITTIEFDKEEIRKAFQYACLRGFKHANLTNQMITPETVGIFMNYLISKLYRKPEMVVLDPVVGTGNLITTIANNSDKSMQLYGVDIDERMAKVSGALFDMLGYGEGIFCQDTLTFSSPATDCLVADFSDIEEMLVYGIVKSHSKSILPGGFLIGVFDSQTVDTDVLVNHATEMNQVWKLFGMIKLPGSIVKNNSKSIVIFQRNGEMVVQPKKFLLVELPDFNEKEQTQKVIHQLNNWFANTDFYRI